jgi:hypothetical protein
VKTSFLCAILIFCCAEFGLCAEKEINVFADGFRPDNIQNIYKEVSNKKEGSIRVTS